MREVARAHVLAAEVASASGRYLLSEGKSYPSSYAAQVFRKRFPQYDFPAGQDGVVVESFDNSKVSAGHLWTVANVLLTCLG